jgi:hypothetical protein
VGAGERRLPVDVDPNRVPLPVEALRRGNYPALLALVFPMVGAFLWGRVSRPCCVTGSSANARLEMTQVPGVLGGKLTGRLTRSSRQIVAPIAVHVTRGGRAALVASGRYAPSDDGNAEEPYLGDPSGLRTKQSGRAPLSYLRSRLGLGSPERWGARARWSDRRFGILSPCCDSVRSCCLPLGRSPARSGSL